MTDEQYPTAPEPTPSDEAGTLRVKETGARTIGAVALGLGAAFISVELARVGSHPSESLVWGTAASEALLVAIGTYSLSLASKFGKQADAQSRSSEISITSYVDL